MWLLTCRIHLLIGGVAIRSVKCTVEDRIEGEHSGEGASAVQLYCLCVTAGMHAFWSAIGCYTQMQTSVFTWSSRIVRTYMRKPRSVSLIMHGGKQRVFVQNTA
jgi:hypothetical protein